MAASSPGRPARDKPHVVTLGGGTGHYALLTGLRELDVRVTAIVTMMDSGGSSGQLRDEYGVLPPGDFTRCLIALSSHPEAMKELLGHRFVGGSLSGHTVRNLIFAALEEITQDTAVTVARLHDIFDVRHRVLPVTVEPTDLVVHLENERVIRGEANLDGLSERLEAPVLSVVLDPPVPAFGEALEALRDADVAVIGPGDLYTSLVPNLLVEGVPEAIADSGAEVLFVAPLMTKRNETPGYSVGDAAGAVAMVLGPAQLTGVLYQDPWPADLDLAPYAQEGSEPVRLTEARPVHPDLLLPGDFLTGGPLVRHQPRALARAIARRIGLGEG